MSIVRFTGLISASISNLLRRCPQASVTPASSVICRGFKDRSVLQLRCKDCYYKKVDDRWWVLCNTHPRHKQRQLIDDVKKRWIVTHRTIGHRPFQKKEEAYICNQAPPGPYDYKVNRFVKDQSAVPEKYRQFIAKTNLGLNRKLFVKLDDIEDKDIVKLY